MLSYLLHQMNISIYTFFKPFSSKIFLSVIIIGVSFFGKGFAQNTGKLKITGKAIDAQTNVPLSYASIRLFTKTDSVFVTGAITDEAGMFSVDAAAGGYSGILEFMGYKSFKIARIQLTKDNSPLDLGVIKMTPSANVLDEVEIRAEKSSMELTLDKKVFNVGKDLANSGGTAIDILTNVPSVAVDVEGNVSLRGSGSVRILIDGRPSGLVSFKGGAGLQQLQGSMIERIEVITNPSARYEAEGMGGIINIILKKDRQQGFNGSFDVILGHPTNYGVAANVNYRRKNLNFFVNYTLSYRDTPGRGSQYQEVYRNDSTFLTRQNSDNKIQGMNNSARAGFDYFFNPKNILTASYTWRTSKGKRYTTINYRDYVSNLNNQQSITKRTQDETETEPNSEYSLNYKKTFAREGHELTADVRFLNNWENSDQIFTQNTFLPDEMTRISRSILQRSVNDETEKQWLFQIDYVHPFRKDGKFEVGLRSSLRTMTNDYWVREQNEQGVYVPLPGLTNNFVYEENIHALYGILGNKVNKFSYQLGLRGELTDVKTTLKQTNEVNPRNYFNLFPSAHFTYELPKQNALQVSYSRRTRRPRYNDLSPFMTFSDSRNFYSGNPDLNPEFTDAFEIGHIKYVERGSFTSSLYYRYTTGEVERIRRVDSQGNSITRPENLATENAYGLELTSSYNPFDWWKIDGNFNFYRAITDGSNLDARYKSDTYTWFARLTSRITILKSTDVQVRGNYEAPQQTTQGTRREIATLDLAISRDIFKNNGTITLNVTDVFNSRKFRSTTTGANFYTEGNFQGRLRQINLTLSYRLRQTKLSGKKKDGDDDGEM